MEGEQGTAGIPGSQTDMSVPFCTLKPRVELMESWVHIKFSHCSRVRRALIPLPLLAYNVLKMMKRLLTSY